MKICLQAVVQCLDGKWREAVAFSDELKWIPFDASVEIDQGSVPLQFYKLEITSENGHAEFSCSGFAFNRMLIYRDRSTGDQFLEKTG